MLMNTNRGAICVHISKAVMASKTITAFERVVLLFNKTFVCTNRSARRLCASQCFYVQHAECAADIILSFNIFRTTPVRGYWTVGFGMDVYSI